MQKTLHTGMSLFLVGVREGTWDCIFARSSAGIITTCTNYSSYHLFVGVGALSPIPCKNSWALWTLLETCVAEISCNWIVEHFSSAFGKQGVNSSGTLLPFSGFRRPILLKSRSGAQSDLSNLKWCPVSVRKLGGWIQGCPQLWISYMTQMARRLSCLKRVFLHWMSWVCGSDRLCSPFSRMQLVWQAQDIVQVRRLVAVVCLWAGAYFRRREEDYPIKRPRLSIIGVLVLFGWHEYFPKFHSGS